MAQVSIALQSDSNGNSSDFQVTVLVLPSIVVEGRALPYISHV
jgi:hypothetical protein